MCKKLAGSRWSVARRSDYLVNCSELQARKKEEEKLRESLVSVEEEVKHLEEGLNKRKISMWLYLPLPLLTIDFLRTFIKQFVIFADAGWVAANFFMQYSEK